MRAAAGAALSSHKFSATRPPCRRLRTKFGTCMSHVISWCASTRAIFLPHGAGCAFCRFRAHERHQHRNAARVGAAQRSSLLPAYIGRRAYGLAHFHRHRRLLRCDFTHHSVRGFCPRERCLQSWQRRQRCRKAASDACMRIEGGLERLFAHAYVCVRAACAARVATDCHPWTESLLPMDREDNPYLCLAAYGPCPFL